MRILFAPVRTVYGELCKIRNFQLTKYFRGDREGGGGGGLGQELPYISHMGLYQFDHEIRVWF